MAKHHFKQRISVQGSHICIQALSNTSYFMLHPPKQTQKLQLKCITPKRFVPTLCAMSVNAELSYRKWYKIIIFLQLLERDGVRLKRVRKVNREKKNTGYHTSSVWVLATYVQIVRKEAFFSWFEVLSQAPFLAEDKCSVMSTPSILFLGGGPVL